MSVGADAPTDTLFPETSVFAHQESSDVILKFALEKYGFTSEYYYSANMQQTISQKFIQSERPHILMITNHGVHEWDVIPGLPDTGGQNVFVNQFSQTLCQKGYRITIVNRGGYPHPTNGKLQIGIHHKDEYQRVLYLDDGHPEFVRKEDMANQLPRLVKVLQQHMFSENIPIDTIISHYWDGAQLGNLYNQSLTKPVQHIWVPHSLGSVKKRNVLSERWADLRVDERISIEREITPKVDGIASTSSTIEAALRYDYLYSPKLFFLPPCVDPKRYYPKKNSPENPIWSFLGEHSPLSPSEIQQRSIITEISRTDSTKRKDVLIRAFAKVHRKHPRTLLVVTINQDLPLGKELISLIHEHQLSSAVIVLGSVWDELPYIYQISDIYCTPSIMEGFGMSAQEAAATKIPIVASNKVPFATEYLLGNDVQKIDFEKAKPSIQQGESCFVVPADEVNGFVYALNTLLADKHLRQSMGKKAYDITIPAFTWDTVVDEFLSNLH